MLKVMQTSLYSKTTYNISRCTLLASQLEGHPCYVQVRPQSGQSARRERDRGAGRRTTSQPEASPATKALDSHSQLEAKMRVLAPFHPGLEPPTPQELGPRSQSNAQH